MVVTIDLVLLFREVVRKNSICYLWWQFIIIYFEIKSHQSRDRDTYFMF